MTSKPSPFHDAAEPNPADKRSSVRHLFRGEAFALRMGKKELELRLKDLSCGGACGLLEEPVAIGDYVIIELDPSTKIEAEVRWVRRVWVGLKFSRSVSPALIARLNEKFAPAPESMEAAG